MMSVKKGCSDHKPVQHRDGKPPWCKECGLTKDFRTPHSLFDTEVGKTAPMEGDYTVKVHRPGGGYSIIDILRKESAERLAEEFNSYYRTDAYYAEPYKPQDEYGYYK